MATNLEIDGNHTKAGRSPSDEGTDTKSRDSGRHTADCDGPLSNRTYGENDAVSETRMVAGLLNLQWGGYRTRIVPRATRPRGQDP